MPDNNKQSPFKGPKPYDENDRLFGRDKELKEMYQFVNTGLLTLFFARSGTGKSSLLKAQNGLISMLKKGYYYLPVYIHLSSLNTQNNNFSIIDYVIERCKEEISNCERDLKNNKEETASISMDLSGVKMPGSLFSFIHDIQLSYNEMDEQDPAVLVENKIRPVLLFDQFEEIFKLPFDHEQLQDLLDELHCLLSSIIPAKITSKYNDDQATINHYKNKMLSKEKYFRIVFSFREEFLPQFESLKKTIPDIRYTNSRYRLEPFSIETAKDVIVNTSNEGIIPISVATAEIIAENIAVEINNFELKIVEPFLLSLVCYKIYPKLGDPSARPNDATWLASEVNNAINEHVEKIYNAISPASQKFIEEKLVTAKGDRTPYDYENIPGALKSDIDKLIEEHEYRLLNKEVFLNNPHIEILHDRLLEPVKLKKRQREERERLQYKQKVRFRIAVVSALTFIAFLFILYFIVRDNYLTNQRLIMANSILRQAEPLRNELQLTEPFTALAIADNNYHTLLGNSGSEMKDTLEEMYKKVIRGTFFKKYEGNNLAVSPDHQLVAIYKDSIISFYHIDSLGNPFSALKKSASRQGYYSRISFLYNPVYFLEENTDTLSFYKYDAAKGVYAHSVTYTLGVDENMYTSMKGKDYLLFNKERRVTKYYADKKRKEDLPLNRNFQYMEGEWISLKPTEKNRQAYFNLKTGQNGSFYPVKSEFIGTVNKEDLFYYLIENDTLIKELIYVNDDVATTRLEFWKNGKLLENMTYQDSVKTNDSTGPISIGYHERIINVYKNQSSRLLYWNEGKWELIDSSGYYSYYCRSSTDKYIAYTNGNTVVVYDPVDQKKIVNYDIVNAGSEVSANYINELFFDKKENALYCSMTSTLYKFFILPKQNNVKEFEKNRDKFFGKGQWRVSDSTKRKYGLYDYKVKGADYKRGFWEFMYGLFRFK